MSYFHDIYIVLKGDALDLDRTEAALLGAPGDETISLWSAISAKHGRLLGHIACAILSVLVQWDHCHKQIVGVPMKPMNYARALVALLAPIVVIWWAV